MPHRLGVVGSLVWDVIHGRDPRAAPVEEWGGIGYALAAFDAALPNDWAVVPLVKVGSDLHAEARDFLRTLRRVAPDALPIEVAAPNNRVEIRYTPEERRSEVLGGGVPPWTWLGLKPLLRDLDALYINLLSGFEIDLETARLIRQHFAGPIYCDLHSLVVAVQPSGPNPPYPVADAVQWLGSFDIVQMNEEEMSVLSTDPMTLAAAALSQHVAAIVVTLGARGLIYVSAPGFETLADLARHGAGTSALGAVRTALVPAVVPRGKVDDGDSIGCGDVLGATIFSRLLAGDTFSESMQRGVRAAARNVEYRGAGGLAHHLRGELILS